MTPARLNWWMNKAPSLLFRAWYHLCKWGIAPECPACIHTAAQVTMRHTGYSLGETLRRFY